MSSYSYLNKINCDTVKVTKKFEQYIIRQFNLISKFL